MDIEKREEIQKEKEPIMKRTNTKKKAKKRKRVTKNTKKNSKSKISKVANNSPSRGRSSSTGEPSPKVRKVQTSKKTTPMKIVHNQTKTPKDIEKQNKEQFGSNYQPKKMVRRRRRFQTSRRKKKKRLFDSRNIYKASISKIGDTTFSSNLNRRQQRRAQIMKTRRRKPTDYDLRGIRGIILKARTSSEKQDEYLKHHPEGIRYPEPKYQRLQIELLVTDITKSLKDIRTNNRKHRIIESEDSNEVYIKMCYSYTDGSDYKTVKYLNEHDDWKSQFIRVGFTINFSIQPLTPDFSISNLVEIGEVAYTNHSENRDRFSLKAKNVRKVSKIRGDSDTFWVSKHFQSLLKNSTYMKEMTLNSLPQRNSEEFENSKRNYITDNVLNDPRKQKHFTFFSQETLELYDKDLSQKHITELCIVKCLSKRTDETKAKKLMLISAEVIEGRTIEFREARKVSLNFAIFGGEFSEDKKRNRNRNRFRCSPFYLFSIKDPYLFNTLLMNSIEFEEEEEEEGEGEEVDNDNDNDNMDTSNDDQMILSMPSIILIGSKKRSDENSNQQSSGYNQIPQNVEDIVSYFENKRVSHYMEFNTQIIIPDIVGFLVNGGKGIPITAVQGIMLLQKSQNSKLKNKGKVTQSKADSFLKEIISKTKEFSINHSDPCDMSKEVFAEGKKLKREYYNLTSFNGNVSQFIRDVVNKFADFYIWAADENMKTETIIKVCSKNGTLKAIRSINDTNPDQIQNLIFGTVGTGFNPKTKH